MKRLGLYVICLCFLAACASSPSQEPSDPSTQDAGSETDSVASEPDAGSDGATDSGTSSHGSGGLPCTSNGTVSVDGKSYSYCVAAVSGVELKIVEPDTPTDAPLRLALYFHGDGAGPYASGLAIKKHAPWTSSRGVLYVAALAPNACSWWLKPGYTTCDGTTPIPDNAIDRAGENAVATEAVIQALRAGWDLADSPVLYGGSSGGSIFLSASYLPLRGDKYPGAYALSCGGDEPWSGELAWDAANPARLGSTSLFFTYGDKDFVAEDVQQAISFYKTRGFPVDTRVIPETVAAGNSHCGNVGGSYSYDQLGRVTEVWSGYLGK